MKEKLRNAILIGITFYAFQSMGQVEDYAYRTPILEVDTGWNSLTLPLDIFSQAHETLSDVRIYRIDPKKNKSIEQPFILEIQELRSDKTEVEFKIINPTARNGTYFYTFEVSNRESVNNIHLDFATNNFDWNIQLEGSMDLNTWSTIIDNYRIVSLKNRDTDFSFTDLSLPESKFNFYKLSFKSSIKPNLKSAKISRAEQSNAHYISNPIKGIKKENDDEAKTTTIELDLGKKLPVSQITMNCNTENDYYRPFKIEGAVDSFNTDKGWKNQYQLLYQGTINSINKNVFNFKNGLFQKIKITIRNFDNQPLTFTGYKVEGPKYRLITRLDDTENIFLVHGNKEAKSPHYDISYFKDKIPKELNEAVLGEVVHFPKNSKPSILLFKNKWWLWGILILVIILLATFTLKMIKEEK